MDETAECPRSSATALALRPDASRMAAALWRRSCNRIFVSPTRAVRLPFNEAKAAQAAARLLKLRGGRMSYMKLIKLLYLVDREALLRWGRPVTTDSYVSMAHGPVLSKVLDLITEDPDPGVVSTWPQLISSPENYEVKLLVDDPPVGERRRGPLVSQTQGIGGPGTAARR